MHGWKVYTEHALRWQQSHMAPPMLPNRPDPASTSLLWTFQAYYVWGATLPTISHSESHATRAQWDCLEFQNCLSVLYKSNQTINVRLFGISELSVSAIQKWSSNQSINTQRKDDFQPTINQSVSQYSEKRDSLLTFAPRCWTAGTPWGTRPCGQWDTDAGCEGSCGGIGHRMCDRSVCPVDWPRVAGRSGTWDPRPPPGSSRTGVCLGVREADRRTGTLWDPMRNGAAT